MKFRREQVLSARSQLMTIIEDHAFNNNLPLFKAGQIIVRHPDYFELMLTACGNWYTGKPPSIRVVAKWRDPEKLKLAQAWPNCSHPDMTQEQLHVYLAAYLPMTKRPSIREAKKAILRERVQFFVAKGHTRSDISEMLGIGLSTVYRYSPVKDIPA
jgi:hypothetical protein